MKQLVISSVELNRNFAFVKGNRQINAKAVAAKVKSIREYGQLSPITVVKGEDVYLSGGDRLAILKDGSLVFCGTAAELTAKSGSRYTISIKTEQGDESFFADNIADAMLDLLEGYRQKGIAVLDIKTDRGTLEQHFMELTGREQQ